MRRPRTLAALVAVAFGLSSAPLRAEDGRPDQQAVASLLLRALAYDRALKTRSGAAVRLAVLHGDEEGDRARDLAAAFRAAAPKGIVDLPLEVTVLEYNGLKDLLGRADRGEVTAVFLTEDLDKHLSIILQVTRNRRIPSLTDHPGLVVRGAAIGVFLEGSRPRLAINLRASRAEGMDLSASVLQLARIVR